MKYHVLIMLEGAAFEQTWVEGDFKDLFKFAFTALESIDYFNERKSDGRIVFSRGDDSLVAYPD